MSNRWHATAVRFLWIRTSSWNAGVSKPGARCTGGYGVETVEDCVIETQTGYHRRRPEEQIKHAALVASLAAVHKVADGERAAAVVREELFSYLDVGEQSLWAHALARKDPWVLCGPDKASLRFGVRMGFRDRLVSLEELAQRCRASGGDCAAGQLHLGLACADARGARDHGRTETPMSTSMTAPLRSVDVRSSIVDIFRRDLVGPGPQDVILPKSVSTKIRPAGT